MSTEPISVLAIIPARSGSKSIAHKNIHPLAGKPMLAYSIEHAQNSALITRIIVSTDSPQYAELARQHGAETPFLRPPEISQDLSTDLEVFEHALQWLKAHEGYEPEICVHLRPTHPIRDSTDIDNMIRILLKNSEVDSVRSVVMASETPYKMWFRDADGRLSPLMQTDIPDVYNQPRQTLPTVYFQNAAIDVIRTHTIIEQHSMTGRIIHGYVVEENFDIDTERQLEKANEYLVQQSLTEKKTFCFDIDGVISCVTPDNQYDLAEPQTDIIAIINTLYNAGHRIVLFTARGSTTGIDWQNVTHEQMDSWGVKYHELLFGKPAAHYYIDDKSLSLYQLRRLVTPNSI